MSAVGALENSIADSLRVLLMSNSIGLASLKLATHTQRHETAAIAEPSAARSLQRLEPIHHGRNKLRYRGMNVHRALYHRVRRLGVHDIEDAMNDLVTFES